MTIHRVLKLFWKLFPCVCQSVRSAGRMGFESFHREIRRWLAQGSARHASAYIQYIHTFCIIWISLYFCSIEISYHYTMWFFIISCTINFFPGGCAQLIEYCQKVFQAEGLDIFLRPYQIVSTGRDCGLVEFIENAQVKESTNIIWKFGSVSCVYE